MADKPIPYGRQQITEEDIEAVTQVLRSDYLTQGPRIARFEEAFAEYIGCNYAVAVSNGTAALHLSAVALGIREGDKVITTPLTFAATANCIRYCGGEVVFADIDPESWLLDIDSVRALLETHPRGTFSGIIPVDFAGRPCDLAAFRELADEYGLWILEDACHAPGGFMNRSGGEMFRCGDGKYADLAIFSFHPVKHIAAGEGGMVTTNDEGLAESIRRLRTHGIVKSRYEFENSADFASGSWKHQTGPDGSGESSVPVESNSGAEHLEEETESRGSAASAEYPGWYMELQQLGYNYRLTDLQAALGLSQLSRAGQGLTRRNEIAERYGQAFDGKSWVRRSPGLPEGHAWHLYILEVENRLGLYNYLREHQIYAQIHYIPLHLMPYYRRFGWKPGDLPHAESYYQGCISLPIFPALTDQQQQFVIETVDRFFN